MRGVGEAAGVRDEHGDDEADDDGRDGQHEAVAEEVEVAVEQRRAPVPRCSRIAHAASCAVGAPKPSTTTARRADGGGDGPPARAGGGAGCRRPRRRPGRSGPGPRSTRSSPMASSGEHEHQRGQLGGGVAVVRAPPDPEHADRHGVDAEVLHGGEVGERLHHHDGGAGGDRRAQHRQHDPPRRLGRRRAERAGHEVARSPPGRAARPGPAGTRTGTASG